MSEVLRFGTVGAAASLVHFLVALFAVRAGGLPPQWANVAGFLVAFAVSFAGHWGWTFAAARAPLARSLAGHFAVSVAGFALNAAAYRWLLEKTALRYDVALALVIAAVAALSFALARYGVFTPGRPSAPHRR